ncbi:MAG TPA: peptidylprolyl isomerase [Fimbriiglobus sp.]|jgi:cyclophilin family peptidyl-prolyl cis-trans isomerase
MASRFPFASLHRWLSPNPSARRIPTRRRLRLEYLEAREVPSVTLNHITDTQIFSDRPLFIPVTPSNTPDGPVSVMTTTGNANLLAQTVTGGRSVRFDVTGTDANGNAFSGSITIRLFEDEAPLATANIVTLVQDHYYDGKLFHRVIPQFIIQGGSPNGDGVGGSTLVSDVSDEFNTAYTFASRGIVAMANAMDDNNNAQFFITDPSVDINTRPNYLNFNHTIVGIMTSGFDVYQKIINTQTSGTTPTHPVTITSATLFTDTVNNVIELMPQAGFSGSANIQVSATDGVGAPALDTFTLNAATYTVNDAAFLGPVANQTVTAGKSVTFSLPFTNPEAGDTITFGVGTPASATAAADISNAPASVTVSINQATGQVTLTPVTGFTGSVDLLLGVWDNQVRRGNSLTDEYDTQKITLSVTAGPTATTTMLATSLSSIGLGRSVLLTATVAGPAKPAGTVQFFDGATPLSTVTVVDGRALFFATPTVIGTSVFQAKFTPADGTQSASDSTVQNVTVTAASTAPIAITATGSAAGSPPSVVVKDGSGTTLFTLTPFDLSFTGGVRVAVGDVNNDGQDDVVTVPAFGGVPEIKAFDGRTGAQILDVAVFENTFHGGLYVDVGDVLGKGYSQILVGAGKTGGPRVTLFDAVQNKPALNYFAYDSTLRGGVTVDVADLRAGGQNQIVTGAGAGGGPVVALWNGYPAPVINGQTPVKFGQFFGGDPTNTAGIRTGEGTLKSDGRRDILVGPMEPDTSILNLTFDPYALGVFVG